jgi:hypothetical protein
VCIALGDAEHAAALYAALAPYAGRPVTAGRAVASYGAADRQLAGLAALLGRDADAGRHFEAALARNAELGALPWLARTQLAYARFLAARGEVARAGELSAAAAAAAESLGLTGLGA